MRIDGPALAAQSQRLEQELALRTAQIYESAGGEFNINSPKQLSEILFDKLQLPVLKRTGTSRAPSTAVEVLEELALAHDLPRHDSRVARADEAEGHLHRRAAAAGQSGHGPRAHLLQPGGRGDRPLEQQRSEPAEHPDPHRARAGDPAGVHRRAGQRPDLGRLLADRVPRAGAPRGRRVPDRGVSDRAPISTRRRR